ncbi:hypothetical protein IOLA_109 [uncultured bacterium]|nr:hypothetical protein IOLA_109 [uncultured bacterium]
MQLNIHNLNIKNISDILENDIINYGQIYLYLDMDDVLIIDGMMTEFMLLISKLKKKYLDKIKINVITGRAKNNKSINSLVLSNTYRKLLYDNLLISNSNIFCGFFNFFINTNISLDVMIINKMNFIQKNINKLSKNDAIIYFFDDRIRFDSYLHISATKSFTCKKYASVSVNINEDLYSVLYNV